MKTNHTPGPWTHERIYHNHPIISSKTDDKGARLFVAHVVTTSDSKGDLSTKEVEANANLIAAAPEMFKALQLILQDEHCDWVSNETLVIAQNAIKNAKGET